VVKKKRRAKLPQLAHFLQFSEELKPRRH
jgi:hypothetical protein